MNITHSKIILPNDIELGAYDMGLLVAMLSYVPCGKAYVELSLKQLSQDYKVSRNTIRERYENIVRQLQKHERLMVVDKSKNWNYALIYKVQDTDDGGITYITNDETKKFKELKLTMAEIGVYVTLRLYRNNRSGKCNVGISTLSERTGLSTRHIKRITRKLEEYGLIQKQVRWLEGNKCVVNYLFTLINTGQNSAYIDKAYYEKEIAYVSVINSIPKETTTQSGLICHWGWSNLSWGVNSFVTGGGLRCPTNKYI